MPLMSAWRGVVVIVCMIAAAQAIGPVKELKDYYDEYPNCYVSEAYWKKGLYPEGIMEMVAVGVDSEGKQTNLGAGGLFMSSGGCQLASKLTKGQQESGFDEGLGPTDVYFPGRTYNFLLEVPVFCSSKGCRLWGGADGWMFGASNGTVKDDNCVPGVCLDAEKTKMCLDVQDHSKCAVPGDKRDPAYLWTQDCPEDAEGGCCKESSLVRERCPVLCGACTSTGKPIGKFCRVDVDCGGTGTCVKRKAAETKPRPNYNVGRSHRPDLSQDKKSYGNPYSRDGGGYLVKDNQFRISWTAPEAGTVGAVVLGVTCTAKASYDSQGVHPYQMQPVPSYRRNPNNEQGGVASSEWVVRKWSCCMDLAFTASSGKWTIKSSKRMEGADCEACKSNPLEYYKNPGKVKDELCNG